MKNFFRNLSAMIGQLPARARETRRCTHFSSEAEAPLAARGAALDPCCMDSQTCLPDPALMSEDSDYAYYRRRAEEEAAAAELATSGTARESHLQLSKQYASLADMMRDHALARKDSRTGVA